MNESLLEWVFGCFSDVELGSDPHRNQLLEEKFACIWDSDLVHVFLLAV